MDLNSQIDSILSKYSALVAAEVGALFGKAFKGGSANGVTNGAHASVVTPLKTKKTAKPAKATKASKKTAAPKEGGGRGEKRDPAVLEALVNSLLAYVTANPGLGIEKISTGMGVSSKELNLPMKKLVKAKRVKTKGLKRSTTYFPKGG